MEDGENDEGKQESGDVFTDTLNAEDQADPDVVNVEEGQDTDGKEGGELKEGDDTTPKEPTIAEVMAKLSAVETKNAELEKAARRAFYNERHDKKADKGKDGETVLTDAELNAIIEANKDDPKVMLNALTYKMNQMMKAGTKAAVDEVAVKNKNAQLSSYVRQIVPDFDKEGSEANESITKVRGDFSLDDHPHGDFLAWAAAVALQLPQVKQASFEAGKKAALEGKADDGRKADIKGGQAGPSGKRGNGIAGDGKNGTELSASQLQTFNLFYGHVKDPAQRKQKMEIFKKSLESTNKKSA